MAGGEHGFRGACLARTEQAELLNVGLADPHDWYLIGGERVLASVDRFTGCGLTQAVKVLTRVAKVLQAGSGLGGVDHKIRAGGVSAGTGAAMRTEEEGIHYVE
jgi:hypothetical protein